MPVSTTHLPFRRIMVTGADGFVGHHLLASLRSSGAMTIAVSRRKSVSASRDNAVVDLLDADGVATLIDVQRPDLIIHLAGQSSVGNSAGSAAQTWATNLTGSMNLALAVARHAPEATVLFASSAEVYGATFLTETANERSPLRPASPYGRSKAAAEAMFDDILPATSRLIVTRASNHSGRGQSSTFVIPSFAQQIALCERAGGGTISVGKLSNRRDFLDVKDVVAAYMCLIAAAPGLPNRAVFNIASGHSIPIGDLLAMYETMSTRPIVIEQDETRRRPGEIGDARLDNSAMRNLGWRPYIDLMSTLRDVLDEQRALAEDTGAA